MTNEQLILQQRVNICLAKAAFMLAPETTEHSANAAWDELEKARALVDKFEADSKPKEEPKRHWVLRHEDSGQDYAIVGTGGESQIVSFDDESAAEKFARHLNLWRILKPHLVVEGAE